MDYKPLTINPLAIAHQKLANLERVYVISEGKMAPQAIEAMLELRAQVDPEFSPEILKAEIEPEDLSDHVDPEPKSFFQRVFGA